ncbi:uncharacterized protein LOC142349999 isoform X2 [Convolutriloba macropyga]|uniref:uncharacterized protein LOC142349999 isoform X2 n=1 Tax=Convolutriloba macropyga TaxID=536237 RepID=UPI003F5290A8
MKPQFAYITEEMLKSQELELIKKTYKTLHRPCSLDYAELYLLSILKFFRVPTRSNYSTYFKFLGQLSDLFVYSLVTMVNECEKRRQPRMCELILRRSLVGQALTLIVLRYFFKPRPRILTKMMHFLKQISNDSFGDAAHVAKLFLETSFSPNRS